MRALAIAAFIFFGAQAAEASPCPPPIINAGFGQTFTGTSYVSGFLWDANNLYLYVMNYKQQYTTYILVPQATAQNFATAASPDTFFYQNVENSFHIALAAENCTPLRNQNGNIILGR